MYLKRILFLSNHHMTVQLWKRGQLLDPHVFPLSEEGRAAFARHVAERPNIPTYLLAELVEEDFRNDTIPHVIPRDQRAIVERKLGQIFRATPYRLGLVQGRESDGRRDNRVLYTALTNPELVHPWLDLLLEIRVPIAGIYTTPLLSADLLKAMKVSAEHVLLVSVEAGSGLRQSYFQRGELKFSRLTPASDVLRRELPNFVAEEVAKTWQYLDSLRHFSRADTLEVYLLAHPDDHPGLIATRPPIAQTQYTPYDIREAASRIGVASAPEQSDATPQFMHLLGRRAPARQFATREEQHGMRVWQTRIGLHAAAVSVLGVALLLGAGYAFHTYVQSSEIAALELQSAVLAARYRQVSARQPAARVSGQIMRHSVRLHEALVTRAPNPNEVLAQLSEVIERFPRVRVQQLVWGLTREAGEVPNYTPIAPADAAAVQFRPPEGSAPVAAARPAGNAPPSLPNFEVSVLEGDIDPFREDYRATLAELDQLVLAVRALPAVSDVKMLRPVLDIGPTAQLVGRIDGPAKTGRVSFAIRVAFKPRGT